jgi:hypothetical protein
VAYKLNEYSMNKSTAATKFKLYVVQLCYGFYDYDLSVLMIDQIYNAISELIVLEDVK